MGGKLNTLIEVGLDILSTTISKTTGSILAQLGNVVAGTTDSDNAEIWGPGGGGFISRPSNPTPGQAACQAVKYSASDRDVIIASRDLRGQLLAGNLQPGESCMYGGGATGASQGRILCKADGSVAIFTTQGNAAGGTGVTFQVLPDGSINMGGPFGGITINSSGISIVHSSGSGLLLNAAGATLSGQAVAINGGSVSLGAGATPATPVVWGPVGISGVGSTSVFCAI